jgi:hypothetical protein
MMKMSTQSEGTMIRMMTMSTVEGELGMRMMWKRRSKSASRGGGGGTMMNTMRRRRTREMWRRNGMGDEG